MMSECCHLQYQPYQRPFRQPLQTNHGQWSVREGIIVRLQTASAVGWGEIAPVSWFGSETLGAALEYLQTLGETITLDQLASIPDALPACQFGLESAKEQLKLKSEPPQLKYSYLLPALDQAIPACEELISTHLSQPPLTCKWKIGVGTPGDEMTIFQQLVKQLPPGWCLRLDANGGLDFDLATAWLKLTAKTDVVEFIEQPLPPSQFTQMLELSTRYTTPIALDESVATLKQLQASYEAGWRGIFVIKAAIAGYRSQLRQFCRRHPIDAVFSSVFETNIGRNAALNLAAELGNPSRAVGFGVDHWLEQA